MQRRTISLGALLATASMLGSLAIPGVAMASAKGRKNTAIGLGAAAAQQLLNGKTSNGVLLGAGAAYAYKRYQDAKRDEDRQKRISRYDSESYRSNSSYDDGSPSYRSGSTYRRTGSTARTSQSRSRYGGASRTQPSSRLVFTGRITDDTDYTNRRLTVTSNGVERRLDVPRDTPVFHANTPATVHDLREGDTVRVSAVRTAPDRWKALRIVVVSSVDRNRISDRYEDRYDQGRYDDRDRLNDRDRYTNRTGSVDRGRIYDRGSTSRTRSTSRYTGTGIVRSVNVAERSFDVQVGGNIRTILAEDARLDGLGSISELRRGDRVRITGDLDGSDVSASDIVLLD